MPGIGGVTKTRAAGRDPFDGLRPRSLRARQLLAASLGLATKISSLLAMVATGAKSRVVS